MSASLVGSEMCIRDRPHVLSTCAGMDSKLVAYDGDWCALWTQLIVQAKTVLGPKHVVVKSEASWTKREHWLTVQAKRMSAADIRK
eukprot:5354192-Alexandrium_andersonii.AAC.1